MKKLESKIYIFEGNMEDGIFSSNKKFFPEDYTEEDIYNKIREYRDNLGKKYHFQGNKMFQVIQKMEDNDDYEDNKYVLLDESYMTKEDYFKEEIKADILVITSKYPNIVLSHRMSDCPVLIVEDREQGISAIAHCGIYHINRELPKELIKCLINNFNSKEENIYLYIGSHIRKDSYIYDNYPKIATNKKVWKDAITEKNNKFYIDLDKAINNQIKEFNLGEIIDNQIDTAKDTRYASHYETYKGNLSKKGQNIVGFYYK